MIAGGEKALLVLAMAAHAGPSTEEFERVVSRGREAARHPRLGRPCTECVCLPEVDFIDDKERKPVGIQRFIGRRRAPVRGGVVVGMEEAWTRVCSPAR